MTDDTCPQAGAPLDRNHLLASQVPQPLTSGSVTGCHRFRRPSTFSLSAAELARHIRSLRSQGWQGWELRQVFDFPGAA
jgi:hypothetical protein